MKRFGIGLGLLALAAVAIPTFAIDDKAGDKKEAKCTCAEIKKAGCGWCDACHSGMSCGKELKSETVYKTVAGVDAPKDMKCKGCAKAAKESGTCEHCHVSFAAGRMYTSPAAYTVASGAKVDAKDVKCADCRKMIESHTDGFCDKCGAGLVHGMVFKGKAAYEKAVQAMDLLAQAVAASAKCEGCAMGMLTDGKCDKCKVSFKNGKPVKA